MAFDEVRLDIGGVPFGVPFRRRRRTEIARLGNGHEERNSLWARSYLAADLSTVARTLDQIHDIAAFWEARQGRARGFRMKDRTDWKSCKPNQTPAATDQVIGTGDGTTTEFQLSKTYPSGTQSYVREIAKPVAGTVLIALDGADQTSGWSVDTTTGVVTFASAPGDGVQVTAGFEFDVPVRFDTDDLGLTLLYQEEGQIDAIPVVEIQP